ncbi:Bcr/CflA family multidrug efflux MFS transporter [Aquincola sp. J276]|uniref:Bcr/CflA family multidrug efflux MFS transporter n=1 Tax=Aquincola sp. J276 TaxID=2898432 RepID=UPI002151C8EF|nr:Bcr/CflA family multidrug efflux MFS transporter [Aquincola sp. J276]MCR5866097.1 Bcr/CflA family multidrug efflux MFS transporter [Aquincola sp. J276]
MTISSAAALPAARAPLSLILVLGGLAAFAPLSIDMYLPAFPAIAAELGVSAGQVQYTLAAYFLGMALGQAFHGPLADRFGRKPPLYAGLALYLLASIGCALAEGVAMLTALRLLQALGGCVCIVVPMAMVRDRFDPQTSARVLSRLMLVMGLAPMLAPLAGSAVLGLGGWRLVFWILAACGVAGLLASWLALPESLPAAQRRDTSPLKALRTYAGLLRDRRFLGHALATGLANAGMFAYIAASPFVLIELHGLSPQAYGLVFGANALGLVAAAQLNHRLLKQHDAGTLLQAALAVAAFAGAGLLAVALLTPAWPALALPGTLLGLFVFVASLGFVGANAAAGALAHQGHQAGSASALMGTLQFTLASASGAAVGLMNDGSACPMGLAMAVAGGLALLAYRRLARPVPS